MRILLTILLLSFSAVGNSQDVFAPAFWGASPTVATFTPPSGCVLWLEADSGVFTDAGTTAATANGALIQQWNDKSGNGNNASQATSGLRGYLTNNIQNGKPGIKFDGVGDFMTTVTASTWSSETVFIVAFGDTRSSARDLMGSFNGTDRSAFIRCTGNAPGYGYGTVSASALMATGVAWDGSKCLLVEGKGAIPNGTIYTNGVSKGTSAAAGANGANNSRAIYINTFNNSGSAGGNYTDARILAIMVFNTALSDPNRASVEAYLAGRYGL